MANIKNIRKNITRIKRRKKRTASYQLKIFWLRKKKQFSIDNLILIANPAHTDNFMIRKRSLKEFLERIDKIFDEFNRMLNAARDILEKHESLKQQFWDQILAPRPATDNYAELIYANEVEAAKRFNQEVEKGTIIPKEAKKVWMSLFVKFIDRKSRKNLWKKIKRFDPDDREIKSLFDSYDEKERQEKQEIMSKLPSVAYQARRILNKNKKRREKREKLLTELKKLITAAAKEKSAKQKQE